MKDYSAMSDQKINTAVGLSFGEKIGEAVNGVQIVNIDAQYLCSSFDPCNNPADAWPIIQRNRISLIWVHTEIPNRWDAGSPCHMKWATHQINGLRAAMEVYLMMKDAEKSDG